MIEFATILVAVAVIAGLVYGYLGNRTEYDRDAEREQMRKDRRG